jgi:glycosyltransferase involved in cell wall biosynthesis
VRILFMLGMYQPRPSANGICCEQVIKELINFGYDVTCIVNGERNSPDVELLEGAKIHRIKTRLTYRLIEWVEYNDSSKLAFVVNKIALIMNKIKSFIFSPFWPLVSPAYTYRFYTKAKELYHKQAFHIVVPVYTPIDSLIAGYMLKRKFPEIKYVPYFLDSLSGGYGPKIFSKSRIIKVGLAWEKRLLTNADRIVVMKSSENHHRLYNANSSYFEKFKFLDIPLMVQRKRRTLSAKVCRSILDSEKINLVYAGSIPYPIRNPEFIFKIFENLSCENAVLTFIGTNNCPSIFKKAQEKLGEKLNVVENLPHESVLEILQQADFLINIGNNNDSMVPSKIFEYMAMGKPIISTYPIDNEPCIPYLKQYPLALLLDERDQDVQKMVERVNDFINNSKGKNTDYEEIKDVFYKNTPNAFIEIINGLFLKENIQ